MRQIIITLVGAFSLAVTGCVTKNEGSEIAMDGTPSFSTKVVKGWPKGRAVDEHDQSRVRTPEAIHAYHVGRLPSKDRRSMSEAHTVYRKEQDARWDQRLPATPMSSRGVVLGIRDPSHRPVPDSDLVKTELLKQRSLSDSLSRSEDKMRLLENQLKIKIEQFDQSNQGFSQATKNFDVITSEKKRLAEELDESRREVESLQGQLEDARMQIQTPVKASEGEANLDAFDAFREEEEDE